jgi:hypothetical protein
MYHCPWKKSVKITPKMFQYLPPWLLYGNVNAVLSGNFLIQRAVVLFQKELSRFCEELLHLLRRLLSHFLSLNHFLVFPWSEILFHYTRPLLNSDCDFSFCNTFCKSSSLVSKKSWHCLWFQYALLPLGKYLFLSYLFHQPLSGSSNRLVLFNSLVSFSKCSYLVCWRLFKQLYTTLSPEI